MNIKMDEPNNTDDLNIKRTLQSKNLNNSVRSLKTTMSQMYTSNDITKSA